MKRFDVVRVTEQESVFYGLHGFVDQPPEGREQEGLIWVKFLTKEAYRAFWGVRATMGQPTMQFWPEQVVPDEDIDPKEKVRVLFGEDGWNALFLKRDRAFDPTQPCEYEGCGKMRERRVMFNDWGTVCEADVCADHASVNGLRIESFPRRKSDPDTETVARGQAKARTGHRRSEARRAR